MHDDTIENRSSTKFFFFILAPPNACLGKNPCLNNARCIPKHGGTFYCLCGENHTGIKCENSK